VRKVLCSIGTGPHEALLDISGETFAIFADRHGYDLDLRRELPAPERPPPWSKIPLILGLFERYDLVLWLDADSAIVDPTADIASELGPRHLMGLVAHEYDGQVVPNSGVWVLRRHRSVRRLLDRMWNRTEYFDHDWWENAALIHELGFSVEPPVRVVRRNRMRARVGFLDRAWNSIQADPAPHPRINHYPGRSQAHRLEFLAHDLEVARDVAARAAPPSIDG
jgi:hypothetical protein